MKAQVKIPDGVKVDVNGLKVKVSGKNATLERDFSSPLVKGLIKIEQSNGSIDVISSVDKRQIKAYVGMIAARIAEMARGAQENYVYKLKIVFMHFPMTVKVSGDKLVVTNFLGGKAPRTVPIPKNVKVEVQGDMIVVSGPDKELTGNVAAHIENATRITARDRRVFEDGIFIVEKPSKV